MPNFHQINRLMGTRKEIVRQRTVKERTMTRPNLQEWRRERTRNKIDPYREDRTISRVEIERTENGLEAKHQIIK